MKPSASLGQKRWVQELLALGVVLVIAAILLLSGVGLLWVGIAAVFARIIWWFVESSRDSQSYRASPGAVGVPWKCDLCGRHFPDREAAVDHTANEHPGRADAHELVSVASGMGRVPDQP